MGKFGTKSESFLVGVHPRLAATAREVVGWFDHSITDGLRSNELQEQYFREGKSKARAGESKHNPQPDGYSHALDRLPYPISPEEWKEFQEKGVLSKLGLRCAMLAGAYIEAGRRNGLELRWGCDWDQDENLLGKGFSDAPHIEIVRFI
jgi:hypothetical protein